jgi:DNA (cytosine-5)-methyltransferase 1
VAKPGRPIGRVLSLFTGMGGLDLGLEQAGLTPVACLDSSLSAQRVVSINRPDWPTGTVQDVATAALSLTPKQLGLKPGDLDAAVGGPPCQPFSKAAQWTGRSRNGLRDPRAHCVHGMLDLVESFLPRALVIENVAGFLRGPVSALGPIQDRLERINRRHGTNYSLQVKLIDTAGYGVPQHRERVIAIAYRDGQQPEWPSPTHAERPVRAYDALWDLDEPTKPSRTGYWTELLPSIPEGANYLHHTQRGAGVELFGWRSRYWSFLLKLAKDRPSWTLPASPGPSTGPFHWDNRPLSIRERMRLQSFPDSWQLPAPEREQSRLVGNATPPLLGEIIGRVLVADLELGTPEDRAAFLSSAPDLVRPRRHEIPPPHAPEPVPARYVCHIGAKAAHPGEGRGPAPRSPGLDIPTPPSLTHAQ